MNNISWELSDTINEFLEQYSKLYDCPSPIPTVTGNIRPVDPGLLN